MMSTSTCRVGYLVTWFPKLTETFVLNEILAVEQDGVSVELYPLRRGSQSVVHEGVQTLVRRAHFTPWLSWSIVISNLAWMFARPCVYLSTWCMLFRANWGSIRYWTGAMLYFPKAVHLARLMMRERITHIHAHFASHPAAVAYVIHRLTGIPYSFTAHGSDLHRDQHMLREKVAAAEFVVVISEFNRAVIHTVCGDDANSRIKTIHCGVDTTKFARQPSQSESKCHVDIGCIGTFHEVKGQKILLRAAAKLKNLSTPVHLHFVGDGSDLKACRELSIELGLEQSTTFHGRCTQADVARLLMTMDIVAAPSVPTRDGRKEGIPVALMEAMAAGTVVVASRLSGIPELVQDEVNGLLVPPGDADSLANALERLAMSPDLRRQLAAAARKTVETDFDLYKNAEQLADGFLQSSRKSDLPRSAVNHSAE